MNNHRQVQLSRHFQCAGKIWWMKKLFSFIRGRMNNNVTIPILGCVGCGVNLVPLANCTCVRRVPWQLFVQRRGSMKHARVAFQITRANIFDAEYLHTPGSSYDSHTELCRRYFLCICSATATYKDARRGYKGKWLGSLKSSMLQARVFGSDARGSEGTFGRGLASLKRWAAADDSASGS